MGTRKIQTGVGTYRRASDGEWGFGFLGEEVEVHEDDLERFDKLNPEEPESDADGEADGTSDEPTFSQAEVDAAVKAATDAQVAELEQAKADLAAARAEIAKTAAADKTVAAEKSTPVPAKAPAAKQGI